MEISEFSELNVFVKLLSFVKFSEDLDFHELKEFAGSPIIAEIFKRANYEYILELKNKGYVKTDFAPSFKFHSLTGKAILKRINALSEAEKKTLIKNNTIDGYLNDLLVPLQYSQDQFQLLKNHATEIINPDNTEWQPISFNKLYDQIIEAEKELNGELLNFWELIHITPEKWQEPFYGNLGGGFWVVAICGNNVIWYNDIEEGFNISKYNKHSEIAEYHSNQDELIWSITRLFDLIKLGGNVTGQGNPPINSN